MIKVENFVYIISFQCLRTQFIFTKPEELLTILKENSNRGINFIKEFDQTKLRFKRVKRELILKRFAWHTETNLYLKDHYYFN